MWKPIVAMLSVEFAFGIVNVLFKNILTRGINFFVIITYRQAFAVIALAPLAYFLERKGWTRLTYRLMWGLFLNGLLGATITSYLFLIGLKYTSVTYACAFVNIVPVTTFILAVCFRLEKLDINNKSGRAKVVGTLICIGGTLVLTLYKGSAIINSNVNPNSVVQNDDHKAKKWAIGTLFLAIANVTWSSWFLIQARIGKTFPFPYSSTAIASLFSATQSAILGLAIDRNLSEWILRGPIEISTIIFAGMVGTGLCYSVMCWCIRKRGPVFTSAFSPLIQMFAAILDIFFLHAIIYIGSILGSVLVIIGMYALLWGKSLDASQTVKQDPETGKDEEDNKNKMQISTAPANRCLSCSSLLGLFVNI
ncbi:hypothetical protein Leryth_024476 [Lithospermum erythrorhizon]|nr:hypothetical protein Leryth_024476 [Lithospermum erythrorhizon]